MTSKLFTTLVVSAAALFAGDSGTIAAGSRVRQAIASNNLARDYAQHARWYDAEKLYRESIDVLRTELGPRDPKLGVVLNNLGVMYEAVGRYDEAARVCTEALAIHEAARLDLDIANDLVDLAAVYADEHKFSAAEKLLLRAMHLGGDSRPEVVSNLGSFYLQIGRAREAGALLERAYNMEESEYGHSHESVGLTLNLLAECALAVGDYRLADERARDAHRILEKTLGPHHPSTLRTLLTQAMAIRQSGRPDIAEPLFREVIETEATEQIPPRVRAAHLTAYASLLRSIHRGREARHYEQLARSQGNFQATVDVRELVN